MPRNVSGTYTLPLPPVVPNTVIQAAWANTTDDDIAQGITDSLDRQGRGGMIAPFRIVDGSIVSPALAFSAETGTGFSRPSAGVLAVSIMGVKVGQFSSTGLSTLVAGLFPDGTLAAPSISFTSDSDTGFYKPGVGNLSVGVDGKRVAYFDTRFVIEANTTASSPSLVVSAGNNAVGAGFAIDILGSGIGTDQSIVRMLNNGYSIVRFQLLADSAGAVMGTPGAIPLSFVTNNVSRCVIDSSGNARFSGPLVAGANFYVGETTAGAGTVGISGGLGAATVYWGNTSAGLGAMDLAAAGVRTLTINPTASGVNYWTLTGASTGNRVAMNAQGSDTNVGIQWSTKGSGDYAFFGNGGVSLQITNNAVNANRWLQIAGSVAPANPTVSSNSTDINFNPQIHVTGVAVAPAGNGIGLGFNYTTINNELIQWIDSTRPSSDDRINELRWAGGAFYGRVLNAAYSGAANWLTVSGGFAAGVADITFGLSNPAAGQFAAFRINRVTTSIGNVGAGGVAPVTQLQATGLGQASAAIFDPASVPTTVGATLFLTDTGVAAGNGGCVMFGAFNGTLPAKHFASIRGYITDASNNSAGDLILNTKDTSTDTGSTQVLRLTSTKQLLDNRGLTLMRDPGTAGGATLPIGSTVFGTVGGTVIVGLGVVNAATNNITINGTNGGANAVITGGTWRNLGARDVAVGHALWLRTA